MTSASKSTFVLGHRHLLGIEGLSAADINGLLDLSEEYVELNRQIEYGLVILQAGNYLLKEDYSSAIEYACRAQKLFPSLQHAQLLLELIAREHPELKRKIEEGERTAMTLVARKNAAMAQRKVAEVGFEWETAEQVYAKFLEEARELYPQIGSTLRSWRAQPSDKQLGRNLQRSLHTLKGSARMAGAMRLGELTHRVEDRVDKAVATGELSAEFWNELDNYLDRTGALTQAVLTFIFCSVVGLLYVRTVTQQRKEQ